MPISRAARQFGFPCDAALALFRSGSPDGLGKIRDRAYADRMEHVVVDLGQLRRGAVVELHLAGNAANVWLMESSTYSRYKRGNSVRSVGGHTRSTTVTLQTDRSGHWYAVADLGGYPGRLGLQARVLRRSRRSPPAVAEPAIRVATDPVRG